jgi:predicted nucleic-acid-binding protein
VIGLDTNVIVRYLVQDDPLQAEIATRIFETRLSATARGFVSAVTLREVVWVLKRGYKRPKPELCSVIRALLEADELEIEHRDLVWRALSAYHSGAADFSAYLIGECARVAGAKTTLTFDSAADAAPLFTLAE